MKRFHWETWVGLFVLAFSLTGLALIPSQVLLRKLGERTIPFPPGAFPALALSLLALMAALMAARAWFAPSAGREPPPGGPLRARALAPFATFVLYIFLVEWFGMLPATPVAVALFACQLGMREWRTLALIVLLTPLFIWVFFGHFLGVVLPEGRLFGGVF